MRQIILDTETTGLSWERGNRVVEIGCVEFIERRPTGRHFHKYVKPDCDFEAGAQEVTGLSLERLANEPRMEEVVEEFLEFIRGAELIIHNAAFDVGFLNNELSICGAQYGKLADHVPNIEDSLQLARQRYPGQRNSLDALCKRLGVDNSHRQLHGALLDAQLLGEVYIGLTSGQEEIGFGDPSAAAQHKKLDVQVDLSAPRPRVIVLADEMAAHQARLEKLRKKAGKCVWDLSEPLETAQAVEA
ncbi:MULTISPECIES: DNA polymerase III subunit epsilon [unclassified Lysobacter]|uniref:DNA polymerase III subunit epsilon n=1 Tax=unclassified Lysobacter TaxID=2635362 RepID=UPI001BEB5ECD|nr:MULTISPECIES: DNA polymerase III subunit epsilon [unclassified Lysobacter]MBT2747146.1 DNA polymerase III subunit epsilon [Lysobacter sp. ISL-42]MBT2752952.1 DNA polymerase III subunit epsilon [Lysobacter sp. ISL-50]MBT2778887.1 DNA polymerase III subunit epsilon [Lysobacter sp. ISL-54]MBT2784219.1 DNA polymerase III subunit epsilon [Lysobacter sp. ISL-52]